MRTDPLQDMTLHTGSFLDDSHFHCSSDAVLDVATSVLTAWKRSLEFDQLLGLLTNAKKSFFFCNHRELQAAIKSQMTTLPEHERLSCCNSFLLVGSVVTAQATQCISYREHRIRSANEKLRKIRYTPVRFADRVKMACAVFKAAIFGIELLSLTKSLNDAVRGAVVYVMERQNVATLLGHNIHSCYTMSFAAPTGCSYIPCSVLVVQAAGS